MNKLLLLFTLSLLLLIPLGLSVEFNFDANKSLVTDDFTDRIKAFDNGTYWFVTYQDSQSNRTIDKLDHTFTSLSSSVMNCGGYSSCNHSDCEINEYLVGGLCYECFGVYSNFPTLSFYYSSIGKYWLSNDTKTYLSTVPSTYPTSNRLYPASSNSLLKIWKEAGSATDGKYTITQNLVGDGTFDFPSVYENPQDIQALECGGNYHVVILKSNKVYDLVYDFSRNFKNVYQLSASNWYILENDYGISTDNETLYFVTVNQSDTIRNPTLTDIPVMNIQGWVCGYDQIINLYSKFFNQTDIQILANTTTGIYIKKPYFTKSDFDKNYLFYELEQAGTNNLLVSYDSSCSCYDWVNTNICQDEFQLQTRVCSSNCDVVSYPREQYISSTYCANAYNASLGIYEQKTYTYSEFETCDTGFQYVSEYPTLGCTVSIELPLNCSTTIKTNATTRLMVEAYDSFRGQTKDFTITACNPLYTCSSNTTPMCQEAYNDTVIFTRDYDNYGFGETASSAFTVSGINCLTNGNLPFGFNPFAEGWLRYRVLGTLSYECDKYCGGYYCTQINNNPYSVVQNLDCSYNDSLKVPCTYGCNQATGLCKDSSGEDTTGGGSSECSSSDILCKYLHPDSSKKFIYALIGCVGIGFFLMWFSSSVDKDGKFVLPIFLVGFGIGFIIFTYFGWINFIFIVFILAFLFIGILLKVLT